MVVVASAESLCLLIKHNTGMTVTIAVLYGGLLFLAKLCVTGGKESWQIQKDGFIHREVGAPLLTALQYSMKLRVERLGREGNRISLQLLLTITS